MKTTNSPHTSKSISLFFKEIDQRIISKGKHFYFKQLILHKYNLKTILARYKERSNEKGTIGSQCPIWICWWQGEENMPEIVKACYASVHRHAGEHPVILITEKNYRNYADMPDYILKRLHAREMSITHFSDLLRMNLLKQYGGIWADSTIFLTKDIDSVVNPDLNFYSCRHIANNCNVVRGRWTSFFIACGKGNILPSFMLDAYYDYWRKNAKIVTYLFLDYLFALAHENIPAVAEMVNSLPLAKFSKLSKCLNMKYEEKNIKEFYTDYGFHKLTYKKQFNMQTPNGEETIYARLISCKELYPIQS